MDARSEFFFVCLKIINFDKKNSFELQVKHFCPNVPIILVGNKKDLRNDPHTIKVSFLIDTFSQ